MARARRFPIIFEFAGTEEHDAAFTALAANSLFTKSDLLRMACDQFLRQQGVLAPRVKTQEHDQAA